MDAAVQAAVLAEQEAIARQQLAPGNERKRPLDEGEGDAERDSAHYKVGDIRRAMLAIEHASQQLLVSDRAC